MKEKAAGEHRSEGISAADSGRMGWSPGKRFLKSRWILPISSPPVNHGMVELDGERVVAVHGLPSTTNDSGRSEMDGCHAASAVLDRAQSQGIEVIDYGNALIMPGLINLHSHIDYTALRGFDSTADLFRWIPKLMSQVRQWQPEHFFRSAHLGAMEMLRAGTTCVVDSSYSGQAAVALGSAGMRAVVALELFGVDGCKADECFDGWLLKRENLLSSLEKAAAEDPHYERALRAITNGLVQLSIAPHAPYTVSAKLMKKAADWSRQQQLPFCVHVAESSQEWEWTHTGNDQLDSFLLSLHGVVPDGDVSKLSWRASGKSSVKLLHETEILCDRLLAAHCVHLSETDIELLAVTKTKVAHCPRSNARLGNGIAPLSQLLTSGTTTGLGTDSAASTDNLDLLAEASFASKLHRAIDPTFVLSAEQIVRMCTLDAAEAAGLSQLIGSLDPGKFADMAIFNLDNAGDYLAESPYEALLHGALRLDSVIVGGNPVLTSHNESLRREWSSSREASHGRAG